jgi:hypothetical protein
MTCMAFREAGRGAVKLQRKSCVYSVLWGVGGGGVTNHRPSQFGVSNLLLLLLLLLQSGALDSKDLDAIAVSPPPPP